MSDSGIGGEELVRWAQKTAREQLADLHRRLVHVEAVAHRAEYIASVLDDGDRVPVVAAAYLHDVGYAAVLRKSGLHPLDGARWLHEQGINARVCNLVAHHSGARFEAEQRGLLAELDQFDLEVGPAMDALVFADMTTGPDGIYVSFDERLDDILTRYPPGDPVHRAMARARPVLWKSVERILLRLSAAGHPMYGVGRASR